MVSKGITGIVLAGGKSRRMGAEKGLLKLGEKHMIEYAIDALSKDVISLLKKNLSNPYPHLEEDEFQWAWNQKLSKYLEVNWYK